MTTTIICTDETIMLSEDETVALQQNSPYLKEVAQLEVGDTLDFNITGEVFRALVDYAVSRTQCSLKTSHREIFRVANPYSDVRYYVPVYIGSVYIGDSLFENAINKCTCKYPILYLDNNSFDVTFSKSNNIHNLAKLLQFNVEILNLYFKKFVNIEFIGACEKRDWKNIRSILSVEAPFKLLNYFAIKSGFLKCCDYRNLSLAKQLFALLRKKMCKKQPRYKTNRLVQTWVDTFSHMIYGQDYPTDSSFWKGRIDVIKWLYSAPEFNDLIIAGLFKNNGIGHAIHVASHSIIECLSSENKNNDFINNLLEVCAWLHSLYIYHSEYTRIIYNNINMSKYVPRDLKDFLYIKAEFFGHKEHMKYQSIVKKELGKMISSRKWR